MIKKIVKKCITSFIHHGCKKRAYAFYSNVDNCNYLLNTPSPGEKEWLDKWRQYDHHLSPHAYRVFSHYIGQNINIVPLEVCSFYCEPVLTPHAFNYFYSDKNSIDLFLPKEVVLKTILRKIRGRYYDRDYNIVSTNSLTSILDSFDCNELVVKPSLLSSGKGVEKFIKDGDNCFMNSKKEALTLDYINEHYPFDCVIQEAFSQHAFFSALNPTSVNTIRVVTFRDTQGVIQILNCALRIGSKGSVVDNAHAGGVFIGITSDGYLGNYVCDQYGRCSSSFNGMDFSKKRLVLPSWGLVNQKISELAKYVIHHDLIQWDVVIDSRGVPYVLEVNVGGYGGWLYQFVNGPMFGEFTDEVMTMSDILNRGMDIHCMFYRRAY